MKIGFRTVGFREWRVEDALKALADGGYEGVELCLEHPDMRPETLETSRCHELAGIVADLGLRVASVSYHGDREPYEQRAANQVRCLDLASHLGAEVLVLNARHTEPGREQEQWDELAELLRSELLPGALELGLGLAFEPEPGMFLNGTAEMLRLIEELDHPSLGVNLDIGHAWLTDDDLLQSIRLLAPNLLQVHWEDFPAGEHQHLVPGQGDMPLAEIHQTLVEVGFDGYYVVDLFNIADDPLRYAEESFAAMRRA